MLKADVQGRETWLTFLELRAAQQLVHGIASFILRLPLQLGGACPAIPSTIGLQ